MLALSGAVLAFLTSATFDVPVPVYWWPVCVLLGFLVGWRFIGGQRSLWFSHGISHGLGGVILMVFWAFFAMSLTDMVRTSLRGSYDSPMAAILAIFQLFVENIGQHLTGFAAVVLVILGIVAGVVTTIAKRITQPA